MNTTIMHLFIMDVDATGIDPLQNRVIQICIFDTKTNEYFFELIQQSNLVSVSITNPLEIAPASLLKARRFAVVIKDLFSWIELHSQSEPTHIISHNGHHFTFPIVTKEMRRCKTQMNKSYILWDTIYTIREQFTTTSNCKNRINLIMSQFKKFTGFEIFDTKGIELLQTDNENYIASNPQPLMQTKFLRVN